MDPFHARLARVALATAEPFGFALAGGYAVQVHGFLDRPSADVDIFTTSRAEGDFPVAVDAVLAALRGDGLIPEAEIRNRSFARIAVATPDGGTAKIEMGVDWRANQPSRLSIGPVLHPDDAVANKVCALFGRAEVRDYVDVDAIVSSGRYGEEELLSLAEAHDPGFDRQWFAEALAAVDRLPDDRFQLYELTPAQAAGSRRGLLTGRQGSATSVDCSQRQGTRRHRAASLLRHAEKPARPDWLAERGRPETIMYLERPVLNLC